jgi:hypothetical protein
VKPATERAGSIKNRERCAASREQMMLQLRTASGQATPHQAEKCRKKQEIDYLACLPRSHIALR